MKSREDMEHVTFFSPEPSTQDAFEAALKDISYGVMFDECLEIALSWLLGQDFFAIAVEEF